MRVLKFRTIVTSSVLLSFTTKYQWQKSRVKNKFKSELKKAIPLERLFFLNVHRRTLLELRKLFKILVGFGNMKLENCTLDVNTNINLITHQVRKEKTINIFF